MTSSRPIEHFSERVLEFDQLRQTAPPTRLLPCRTRTLMRLTPSRDRQWIERQQQLTDELRGYLRVGGRFDFHGLLDPTH